MLPAYVGSIFFFCDSMFVDSADLQSVLFFNQVTNCKSATSGDEGSLCNDLLILNIRVENASCFVWGAFSFFVIACLLVARICNPC
ncbi:hypothetical protein B0E34_09135 [Chryseobacterium mucoviscidosis]|uniref:Uncharacterized protein n=1 Tax=Chryseobacterium mucoviscidosis TaxID=1945581 RepID=A0A202C232_9FLAO|nr:hypothetical protein B0E34_09135 [Chryseobacterium mucoviscidosis]